MRQSTLPKMQRRDSRRANTLGVFMDLGKRIMIMGCAGSGKSTLARQIGEAYNLPVVHLDTLFWLPGWIINPDKEQEMTEAADKPEWVMDGNYSSTMEHRIERADTVIFLDYGRFRCLYRVTKRRLKWHGKSRPDITEGCNEQLDREFIKWIWGYPKRSRVATLELMKKIEPPKQAYHLKGNKAVREFVGMLKSKV